MNVYKSPRISSYNHDNIIDAVGPGQTAYVNFRITGGWDSAQNALTSPHIQAECLVNDVKLAYRNLKVLNSKNV